MANPSPDKETVETALRAVERRLNDMWDDASQEWGDACGGPEAHEIFAQKILAAVRDELDRATPPSPSTAPMCEHKTAKLEEEGYAKTGYVLRQPGKDREVVVSDGGAVSWFTTEQWNWLMFNRDHVEFNWPKPLGARLSPNTAPEVQAGHKNAGAAKNSRSSVAPEVGDGAVFEAAARIAASYGSGRPIVERRPNDLIRGRWEGEQAASANIARMLLERAALASRPAEVGTGRLPELPPESARASKGKGAFFMKWSETGKDLRGELLLFTAEQYRQGQRDAVAADRARRGDVEPWAKKKVEFLAARIAQKVATNCGSVPNLTFPHIYLELCDVLLSAPSHTNNKENG